MGELTDVASLTPETHELGLALADRFELSIYDAMITAAALLADCDVLWSEVAGQLRIQDPFR